MLGARPRASVSGVDRLDLELYADRLARHGDRLADEIAAARLRLAWGELERDARERIGTSRSAVLEAVGVFSAVCEHGDDARLIERRESQLAALGELAAYVEERIETIASGS